MILKTRIVLRMAIVVGLLLVTNRNLAQDGSANKSACALMDKNRPAQFILYEGRSESSPEIKLRLRNNTDCSIIVETDDVLPTQTRKLHNGALRVEPVTGSRDGVQLRLHYLVQDRRRKTRPGPAYGWGDSVFTYQISPGQSVIFAVPGNHFKRRFDLAVPFNYLWEGKGSIGMGEGGVVHRVYFLFDELPLDVLHQESREK